MYITGNDDDNWQSAADAYVTIDDENMGGLAGRKKKGGFKGALKKHSPVARLKKVHKVAVKAHKKTNKLVKKVVVKVVRKIAPIIPILAFIPVIGTVVALIATTVMVLDKKKQAKLAAQAEGRETAALDRAIAEDEGKLIALQRNKEALEAGRPTLTANAAIGQQSADNMAQGGDLNPSQAPVNFDSAPLPSNAFDSAPLTANAAAGKQSAATSATDTGEKKPIAWGLIVPSVIGVLALLKK